MKVALCTLPLQTGHQKRGIGYYTKNLLESLSSIPNLEIQQFGDIHEVNQADIVHYPYFDLFFGSLPIIKRIPTIVTIHDVTPLVFPHHFPPGMRGSLNFFHQRLALKSVKAVITDSQASKIDISKYLSVKPEKISVVYLAPSPHFHKTKDKKTLDKIASKYRLPEKFALYTGSVNWNKNLVNLTQACINKDLDLILTGRDFENRENLDHPERISYREFINKFSNNPKVHILGFVDDQDLMCLTNLASLLLLPSYYEGFGLPIIEAQACGTPVITSNLSSMPEIAGNGALLVDPENIDQISEAIGSILENQGLKDELIKQGLKNVEKFSWYSTAKETFNIYQNVINSSKNG